jgi:chemotaxis signal transduction protein
VTPALPDESISPQIAALLERRAQLLGAPVAKEDLDSVLWVAEFPAGDERYAIPLAQLKAAVPISLVTALPLSAPHVLGILRYEGQIVTALNLATLLSARGWKKDPALLLIVDPGWRGHLVALDCEETPRTVALSQAKIEQAHTDASGALQMVMTPESSQVGLIDLPKLLDRRTGGRLAR